AERWAPECSVRACTRALETKATMRMLRPKRRAFLIVHPAADDYGRSILQQRPPCETAGRNALTIWLLGELRTTTTASPIRRTSHRPLADPLGRRRLERDRSSRSLKSSQRDHNFCRHASRLREKTSRANRCRLGDTSA